VVVDVVVVVVADDVDGNDAIDADEEVLVDGDVLDEPSAAAVLAVVESAFDAVVDFVESLHAGATINASNSAYCGRNRRMDVMCAEQPLRPTTPAKR
jgi:hypothetical protein